jgi:hypothetical protein
MADVPSLLGTEFDIFGRKPKQISTVETNETIYRRIASVDQADIEFVIPGDSDTYVSLDSKLYVKGITLLWLDESLLILTHGIQMKSDHSTNKVFR